MADALENSQLSFSEASIRELLPFHILLNSDGKIRSTGATIKRLFSGVETHGRLFAELFTIIAPREVTLLETQRVSPIKLRTVPPDGIKSVPLSGASVPLANQGSSKGILLMLTPGADIPILTDEFGFTEADFSKVDGTLDLWSIMRTQRQLLKEALNMGERLEASRQEAEKRAITDSLTQLVNRRGVFDHLNDVFDQPREEDLTLFHIDLDHFKRINDTLGHAAGDVTLKHTAHVLRKTFENDALVGRLGGDEFVVVQSGPHEEVRAQELAKHLIQKLSEPFQIDGKSVNIGATIGIAKVAPDEESSASKLLDNADIALYSGKRRGRGTVRLHHPSDTAEELLARQLTEELQHALSRNEIVPYFQPQIDTATGTLVGIEVLARWKSSRRGKLSPGKFLPQASEMSLTQAIDKHIRLSALDVVSGLMNSGLGPLGISFNATSEFLSNLQDASDLVHELHPHGISPEMVTFEILESVLFDANANMLVSQSHALADAGFRLALDDFGTGHASLSALLKLPIEQLKIAREFVHGIAGDEQIYMMTETIFRMGRSMGLSVLAEGVERQDDYDVLRKIGILQMQGFMFACPMSAAGLETWLRKYHGNWQIDKSA